MSRIVAAIVVLLLIVVALGMVVLGAFPPHPRTEQIQRVLPNERFQPR